MAELKAECEDAWKWLKKIPKETWCRSAMDYNCKTDLVVNNLSEVFNKMILDVRAKPIRTMFEGIRTKQMIKRQKTREKTENSRWMITLNYSEKLEENKKRWDMTGVTCSHAIAAMSKIHMHPEDYVHEFFKKELYIEAYKDIVYPVPGPEFWPDTHTPDIEPPVFKEKAGKKQTARRKGQFEVPAPKDTRRMGTITCSNCGLQGHRYTNCGKALKPSLEMRKNLHQENREIFSSSATHPPPQPPPQHQTTQMPASSAPPPKANKRGSTSTVSAGAARSSPAPATGSASTRAARTRGSASTRTFNAPRTSTGEPGILAGKRKRKPPSKFASYFNASGNY
ncbi:uncharacterized protein LOC119279942 [Triticum dicoccoides]|uniref:uncharacterized protein LOC119279942 n=1 Tax=Triticum dicoccoides TaxID=85692 RepID=UPI00188F0FD3|nr:uncharacterized protein LOC119279942 [Triticum dicoccoides]